MREREREDKKGEGASNDDDVDDRTAAVGMWRTMKWTQWIDSHRRYVFDVRPMRTLQSAQTGSRGFSLLFDRVFTGRHQFDVIRNCNDIFFLPIFFSFPISASAGL